jgi:proteasome assembly chaperone (PAC2) family protein
MSTETPSLKFSLVELTTHLRYTCAGIFSPEDFIKLIQTVKSQTQNGKSKVLVNLILVNSDLGVLDRYSLGVIIAAELPSRSIAVVAEKSMITKVAENTAVNRGADLFVTHDENEALTWLLSR